MSAPMDDLKAKAAEQARGRPDDNGQQPGRDWDQRLVTGGTFVLDAPATIPAVWGDGEQIAWSAGEPLLIVGPAGVGKTTIAGQLVAARLGLLTEVLGLPVTPGTGKLLYLACDRPAQVQRAFARLFGPADRELLDQRLVIWRGPPPGDLGRHPRLLAEMCERVEADTVVIDSLKDVALELSKDDTGAGLNSAHQGVVAAGAELLGLHHQRKRGSDGKKPTSLDDVYGSTWLTAGAGSVVLLWGEPGDSIVDLSHLKQPAEPVGPLKVLHDHHAGTSSVVEGVDLVDLARLAPLGITAADVARALFDTLQPGRNQTERARRRLETLVRRERLWSVPGGKGGGSERQPTRYFALTRREEPQT